MRAKKDTRCLVDTSEKDIWDDNPGINAPSKTAESLMDSEGYVGEKKTDIGKKGKTRRNNQ